MAGYVRTNEVCPVCHGKFQEGLFGKGRVLICPVDRTIPRRVYVDCSGFGLRTRKRYSDKNGAPFASYDHADQFLSQLRAAKADRVTWDPREWDVADAREFSFSEEWRKWTESREAEWSARYRRQVAWVKEKLIWPRLGAMDVREIRTAHLIDLKTEVSKKYASSVVKLAIGITYSFLSEMRLRGDIKAPIVRPKVEVPRRDLFILDAVNQERIISAAPERFRAPLRLAARTGVRPCEVCAVRIRDIVGGFIHFQRSIDDQGNVTDTKTGIVHIRPVPADMEGELAQAMRDKLPEAYLFAGRTGTPFRPCYLSREWKRAADAVGLSGSTLTVGTRHSFATRTWKEEEGKARENTMRKMGHKSQNTTFTYYVREK